MGAANTATTPDLRTLQQRMRVLQSIRFTFVCAIIIIVTALAGMTTGITTLMPVVVLVLFLKDESFVSSVAWLVGVLLGALYVLVNTYFWAQVPFLYLLFSMALLFALGYWTAQGIRGRWPYIACPLGASFALLTALFAEMSGAQDGVSVAFLWVKETPLGILIFWVVLIGLWPLPSAKDFEEMVAAIRAECANLLRQSIDPVRNGQSISFIPSPLTLKYFGDFARLLRLNAGKFSGDRSGQEALYARLEILSEIYADIRFMQRSFEDLPGQGLDEETRNAAANIMTDLAAQIDGQPAEDLDRAFKTVGHRGDALSDDTDGDFAARRTAARLAGFAVAAKALERKLGVLDHPTVAPTPSEPPAAWKFPARMTDSLQAATKLIIGILIGLAVIAVTDLPANTYVVIAILVVLAQPNLGRVHLRIKLWFPGALAGSLWAIAGLIVLSYLPYFGIYLAWFLPGLFVSGYLGAGPDRVSYAGMQFVTGMATILGMAAFPTDTLLSAEARILGASIGFLIALAVYYLIWPIHPAVLLRKSIAGNLRELATLLSLFRSGGDESDQEERRADAARRIKALKAETQADFGLLYDFSYMMTRKVRPAYDYRVLLHMTGLTFMQLWCLHQLVTTRKDSDENEHVLKPIETAEPHLTAILYDLADKLERGRSTDSHDIQPIVDTIRSELRAAHQKYAPELDEKAREAMEYGINTVSLMSVHLLSLADAMDTACEREPLATAQLAHLYEGAD